MKNTKQLNQLHDHAIGYEDPSILMMDVSHEGVLCESERQIEDFELLPETDW